MLEDLDRKKTDSHTESGPQLRLRVSIIWDALQNTSTWVPLLSTKLE